MKTTYLSLGAETILTNVLAAMQAAEELGGVTDTADYVALMTEIQREADARRCAALYVTKEPK